MSNSIWAFFEIAPYDETALAASEAGAALMAAIDAVGLRDSSFGGDAGVGLARFEGEAHSGTAAIECSDYSNNDPSLTKLAAAAGLWCRYGDDGSSEWDSDVTVRRPDGSVAFYGNCLSDTTPVLTPGKLDEFDEEFDNDPAAVVVAIHHHLSHGTRSLEEWVKDAQIKANNQRVTADLTPLPRPGAPLVSPRCPETKAPLRPSAYPVAPPASYRAGTPVAR